MEQTRIVIQWCSFFFGYEMIKEDCKPAVK